MENNELNSVSFFYDKKPNKLELFTCLDTFINKTKFKFKPQLYITYNYADYIENGCGVYFSNNINDKHINHRLYNEPDISFDINNRKVTYLSPNKYFI